MSDPKEDLEEHDVEALPEGSPLPVPIDVDADGKTHELVAEDPKPQCPVCGPGGSDPSKPCSLECFVGLGYDPAEYEAFVASCEKNAKDRAARESAEAAAPKLSGKAAKQAAKKAAEAPKAPVPPSQPSAPKNSVKVRVVGCSVRLEDGQHDVGEVFFAPIGHDVPQFLHPVGLCDCHVCLAADAPKVPEDLEL